MEERKIGEIFEHNEEWYQCLKGISCEECDFSSNGITCDIHGAITCTRKGRSDDTSVVFKKLKEVEKPCKFHKKTIQTYKLYTEPFISVDMDFICTYLKGSNTIDIIIKQDIENMGDNDIHPYDELFSPSTVSNTKYLAKEDMKETKLNIEPFSLEAAKAGKPVCTKNGKKARIICFDAKGILPIIALVESGDEEKIVRYSNSGRFQFDGMPDEEDLMMLPEKKEGWAVIRRSDIYETEEQAKEALLNSRIGVMIRKIEWEE